MLLIRPLIFLQCILKHHLFLYLRTTSFDPSLTYSFFCSFVLHLQPLPLLHLTIYSLISSSVMFLSYSFNRFYLLLCLLGYSFPHFFVLNRLLHPLMYLVVHGFAHFFLRCVVALSFYLFLCSFAYFSPILLHLLQHSTVYLVFHLFIQIVYDYFSKAVYSLFVIFFVMFVC